MSISECVYIGPYIQVQKPFGKVNLYSVLSNEENEDKLFLIPSEHYDISMNILIPNYGSFGLNLDVKRDDCKVYELPVVSDEFENEFEDLISQFKEIYEMVIVRYGVVHYRM